MKHDDDTHPHRRQEGDGIAAAACAQVRELLAAAADLPLEPAQQSRVDSHLATCGPCRVVASWMPRLDAVAARSAPPAAPSERWLQQLKSRVMDQVRAEAAAPTEQPADSPLRHGARSERPGGLRGLWPTWPGFLRTPRALATLAVVALVGIFTYAEIRDRAVGTPSPAPPTVLELAGRDAASELSPSTPGEPAPPAAGRAAAADASIASERVDRAEAEVAASTKPRPTGSADERLALRVDPAAPDGARRPIASSAPATPPLAKLEADASAAPDVDRARQSLAEAPKPTTQEREAAAGVQFGEGLSAATAPAEERPEPTVAFDRRTAEVLVDGADSLSASPWDEGRVRGAIALVMQARPERDVEAAVGELLLALEDAPRASKGFARAAKRQQSESPPAVLRAPEAATPLREVGRADAQSFAARGGIATKDLAHEPQAAPAPVAPAWNSIAASAAATSVADSAAAALLLRLPELPDGAVREQALRWLRARGLR